MAKYHSVLSVADKSVNNFIYWTTILLGTCKEANSKPEGNMHVHEHYCRITGSYIKCVTALLECFTTEVCT